jgi:1-deoxy-D-xylulose-5-phosphate reductoisomerase
MAGTHPEVSKLIVTASGGPFRGFTRDQLAGVTPAQAAKHPTWNMGSVITTNSATLVNKGLEVIEAHLLFDIPFDRIEVTVHPQSVVHSLVEFVDGSTMAQCSPPDMHLPIALGLDWPNRVPGATAPIDWSQSHSWTFEPLDEAVFPAVRLARQVGVAGSTFPAVYNAANEVAVKAFNAGRIGFLNIVETIERTVDAHSAPAKLDLDGLLEADSWARATAESFLSNR